MNLSQTGLRKSSSTLTPGKADYDRLRVALRRISRRASAADRGALASALKCVQLAEDLGYYYAVFDVTGRIEPVKLASVP